MQERFCICGRWVIEVEPGVWAHEDDMLVCTPDEPTPVTFIDEVA
jgi:hypothetical protein